MGLGLGFKISLGLLIVIAVMTGGFYWYYQYTQSRIELMVAERARLELAVSMQEQTITRQREFIEFQQQYSTELQRGLSQAESEKEDILSEIRSDLDNLDDVEREEVERRVNEAHERLRSILQSETERWSND